MCETSNIVNRLGMSMQLLAIDQGTSSTRTMLFDLSGKVIASAQQELACSYPHSGWVEQDAEVIWQSVLDTLKTVLAKTDPGKNSSYRYL